MRAQPLWIRLLVNEAAETEIFEQFHLWAVEYTDFSAVCLVSARRERRKKNAKVHRNRAERTLNARLSAGLPNLS